MNQLNENVQAWVAALRSGDFQQTRGTLHDKIETAHLFAEYMMTKKERRQKWTEALRSGEFMQAHGQLRKAGSYCCLGVACEVYRRETGNGEWKSDLFHTETDIGHLGLPTEVQEWLGLRTDEGSFESNAHSVTLSFLNDNSGYSLSEIADVIESQPEDLFTNGGVS